METDAGEVFSADAVILTAPVPLSLALLKAGQVALTAEEEKRLAAIEYDPCVALLARTETKTAVPDPGGLQLDSEPIAWLADNRRKGISPRAWCVTIHGAPRFSRDHIGAGEGQITQFLSDAARPWLDTSVVESEVVRWRYARPCGNADPERAHVFEQWPTLVLAGDAFGGGRVEGAALSGLSAADVLLGRHVPAQPLPHAG